MFELILWALRNVFKKVPISFQWLILFSLDIIQSNIYQVLYSIVSYIVLQQQSQRFVPLTGNSKKVMYNFVIVEEKESTTMTWGSNL